MSAPPIAERHRPHFHQRTPVLESVRLATTANISLSGLQTIDGSLTVANDRVLVKSNTTASQNGIYLAASGAWTRDYDLSTSDPNFNFLVHVREGTVNGGTTWQNTNTSAPTIDTTAINFASIAAGGGGVATADYQIPVEDDSDLTLTGTVDLRLPGTSNLFFASPALLHGLNSSYALNGIVPSSNFRLHYRDCQVTARNNLTLEGSAELVLLDLTPRSNLVLRGVG